MPESSMTGVERAHYRISLTKVVAAPKAEDLDPTMVVESVRSDSQKAMEKSVTLVTGSAKDHCLLWHSQSVLQEKAVAQEQMMALEQKASETVEHRQLLGVRAALRDRKMDQDHLDANSRNGLLLNVLPLLLSKTANGERRCDPTPQPPSRRIPPAKAARHLPLRLLLLRH